MTCKFKRYNICKSINKTSTNRQFLLKIWHAIQQPRPLISVVFHGLICSKIRSACFPIPEIVPRTRTFVVNIFNRIRFFLKTVSNSRKLQARYLPLVGNDSRSFLRRPSYSTVFSLVRASLANPLFTCSCPIGIWVVRA